MPPRAVVSPPRRITRSSLARFRLGDDGSSSTKENSAPSPPPATDIEDVIPSTASIRKRKRTTTILEAPSSLPLSPRRATKIEKTEEVETKKTTTSSATKRQRKPARKTVDAATGETKLAAPSDWEEMYAAVKAMRLPGGAAANAAVDTMGCERLAQPSASPRDRRFQTLIALMLSSQTKDTTNAVAMQRLQTELPPHSPGAPAGLNLENVLAVDPELLNQLIWAVGFHNNKTKYIKAAAPVLRDEWAGDIPDTIEGLVALPGVGPKMAHLCLSAAWDRTEGIGVDVHVHRITNMWGWHATKNPEETRLALQAWLPRDRWREINWLLVGFGQKVCLPVGKKCGDCELGLRGLCRAAERKKVLEGRKVRESATVEKTEIKEEGGEAKVKVKLEEREEEMVVESDVVVNENMEDPKKEEATETLEDIEKFEEEPEIAPKQRKASSNKSRKPKKG
ncbi:DNA glycosylase [Annulohypoxylon bovei var. microspora]|nr:DNA glycosylase [Annulohypoxylon bovei var. microspora]